MQHTILVVEDEPIIRLSAAEYLEECGYKVLQAGNAAEALAMLARNPDIAVVFTDVRMPGKLDGLDLAKWIIQNMPRVVVMIASGDAAKEALMQQLCSAHAFSKPYKLEDVSSKIRELLAARDAR